MTALRICQKACSILGANPPESFDDGSVEADTCELIYTDAYHSLLLEHRWTFAKKKVELNRIVVDSEYGYEYVYNMPNDLLQLLRTEGSIISGNKIHSDTSPLSVEYMRVLDESLLPVGFTSTLVYMLASELAIPLTGHVSKSEALAKKAKVLLNKAIDNDKTLTPITLVRR